MKYLFAKGRKRKNIIISRSFSKAYGLAGIRAGFAIASSETIACLNRAREPFNVNSIAQIMALESLKDKRYVENTVQAARKGKEFIYRELDSMGIKYVPSATNFVLIKTEKDSKLIYNKLLRKGIIVREMSAWKLKNFIRVTVGRMDENKKFIKALKEVII